MMLLSVLAFVLAVAGTQAAGVTIQQGQPTYTETRVELPPETRTYTFTQQLPPTVVVSQQPTTVQIQGSFPGAQVQIDPTQAVPIRFPGLDAAVHIPVEIVRNPDNLIPFLTTQITNYISYVRNEIQVILKEGVSELYNELLQAVRDGNIRGLLQIATRIANKTLENLNNLITQVENQIISLINAAYDILNKIQAADPSVAGFVQQARDLINRAVDTIERSLDALIKQVAQEIRKAVSDLLDRIVAYAGKAIRGAGIDLNQVGAAVRAAGVDIDRIGQGVQQKVNGFLNDIETTIVGAVHKVTDNAYHQRDRFTQQYREDRPVIIGPHTHPVEPRRTVSPITPVVIHTHEPRHEEHHKHHCEGLLCIVTELL